MCLSHTVCHFAATFLTCAQGKRTALTKEKKSLRTPVIKVFRVAHIRVKARR
jgi:hypothetical protein